MTALRGRLVAFVVLAGAFALVYWRFLAGWAPSGRDIVLQYLPYQEMVRRAIRSGEWPWWNDSTFCGRPLMADIQVGVLYPPNWMHWFLPLPVSFTLLFAGHTVFAMAGGYRLCRRLGLDPSSSALFAILYVFGGYFSTKLQSGIILFHYVAAWFPWLALGVLALAERPSAGRMAVLSVGIALSLLAGSPQMTFFIWLMTGLLGAGALISKGKGESAGRGRRGFVLFGLGAFVLAMMLTVPQTFLTRQMTAVSFNRGINEDPLNNWDYITGGSLHPRLLLMMLNPSAFGPGHDEMLYSGTDAGFSEACAYLPVAVWALLIPMGAGFFIWRRTKDAGDAGGLTVEEHPGGIPHRTLFWGCIILTAFGFVMAAGKYSIIYEFFFKHVPGFNLFRVPARWMFVATSAAALAGALSLNHFNKIERSGGFNPPVIVGLLVFAGVIGIPLLSINFKSLYEWLGFYGADAFAGNPIFAEAMRSTKGPQFPEAYSGAVISSGIRGAAFLFAAWIILLITVKTGRRNLAWLVPVVFAAELALLAWPNQTVVRTTHFHTTYYPDTRLVETIRSVSPAGRVLWLDDLLDWRRDQNSPEITTNAIIMQGLRDARGYDPVNARAIGTWFNRLSGLAPQTDPKGYMWAPRIEHPDWLRLMGVSVVLSYEELPSHPVLRPIAKLSFPEGNLGVWQVKDAADAFLVAGDPALLKAPPAGASEEELLAQTIESADWNGFDAKALNPLLALRGRAPQGGTVKAVQRGPNRFRFEVASPVPAWLWFAQTAYPGWTAKIDGVEQAVSGAAGTFLAVAVPAGESEVEFTYHPPKGFEFCRLACAGALAVILLIGSRGAGRKQAPREPAHEGA